MPVPAAMETPISLILLLYQGLDLCQAIATGKISIAGNDELARQFADDF